MRITFDLRNVGFGNNGGSNTLIKCANTLQKLGCDVKVIDSGKNQNTWVTLEVPHVIIQRESDIPDADFIIATGYKSVQSTMISPIRCGIKSHFLRAWEIWVYDEQTIYSKILKVNTIKFVNSIGLQKKLKKYGVDSHIIYPGYDLDSYYPIDKSEKNCIVLGGLYHKKHANIKRVSWLIDTYQELKKNGYNVKLYLLGADKKPDNVICDKYIQNPTVEEKNKFYNEIDIWMSTTMCEGLHLPPAECMLTGCPVVATNAELGGTEDYVMNGVNGIVTGNYLESFIKGVKALCDNLEVRKTLANNSRIKIEEIGSREYNMKKFIEILEEMKINEFV